MTGNSKTTFNGEPVCYVIIEYVEHVPIGMCGECVEDLLHDDFRKEQTWLDTSYIIHEYIEKGYAELHTVNEMVFKTKDGFLTYESKDTWLGEEKVRNSRGVFNTLQTILRRLS
jgi:hypothetical protein